MFCGLHVTVSLPPKIMYKRGKLD